MSISYNSLPYVGFRAFVYGWNTIKSDIVFGGINEKELNRFWRIPEARSRKSGSVDTVSQRASLSYQFYVEF